MTQKMDNLVTFGGMGLLAAGLFLVANERMEKAKSATIQAKQAEAYQAGIQEGIKRATAASKEELPLPVSDAPECETVTPTPKNYLETRKK